MSVEFICNECQAVNAFADEFAGRTGKCGQCGETLRIPALDERSHVDVTKRGHFGGFVYAAAVVTVLLLVVVSGGVVYQKYFVRPVGQNHNEPEDITDLSAAFDKAQEIKLDNDSVGTQYVRIEKVDDQDMFRFQATRTGSLIVDVEALKNFTLDGRLFLYDANKKEIAQTKMDVNQRTGQLIVPVVQNNSYFLKTAAHDKQTGDYRVNIKILTDVGGHFENALQLKLPVKGRVKHTWTIDREGDVDYFRFVAPMDGRVTVEQRQNANSNLDSQIRVYNDIKKQITVRDGYTAQVHFGVKKGQTYYVASSAYVSAPLADRTGAYDLTFRTTPVKDDYHDAFTQAKELTLQDGITTTMRGTLETIGDADMFCFTAPSTRGVLVRRVPVPGSSVFSHLYAYDQSGGKIADLSSDRLPFNISKGKKYFFKIMASRTGTLDKNKTGAYKLTFLTYVDDYSSHFGEAAELTFNKEGLASTSGTIEVDGDADYFRFTAVKTGAVTIEMKRQGLSTLDSYLAAYNSTKLSLNSAGDGGIGVDSRMILYVTAGKTYYVKAEADFLASGLGRTGQYLLTINKGVVPIDHSDGFARAWLVFPSTKFPATVRGSIEILGDQDMFKFTAPATGTMAIRLTRPKDSKLESHLYAYNRTIEPPMAGKEGDALSFWVEKGKMYYVKVAASNNVRTFKSAKTGLYTLSFTLATKPAVERKQVLDLLKKKAYENALVILQNAVQRDPHAAWSYRLRARVYRKMDQHELAVADLTSALNIEPDVPLDHGNRAMSYGYLGKHKLMLADYYKEKKLSPNNPWAYNGIAWQRATCPDPKLRNGKEAVQYATTACELSNWNNPIYLDTLGAAYAELGDFDKAMLWQKKAVAHPDAGKWMSQEDLAQARDRVRLFREKRAYREPYRVTEPPEKKGKLVGG